MGPLDACSSGRQCDGYLQNSPLMPRRIPDYPDALNGWNMICSIGSTMTLFGLFIFK
ncbi:hypothetical protein CNEO4_2570005 [Clostridium neonatale]|nr:hypothetical protein CNEO4_1490001 [Clostridium neonatale]CAI3638017.1 hypothetical protein CNEO4_2150001 [Clostridium neonatale]CAI3666549.1 hypothetical protein CNEO4_2570005 [Clostridium neonatale]